MKYKYSCVIAQSGAYRDYVLVLLEESANGAVSEIVQSYVMQEGEQLIGTMPPVLRGHAGTEGFVSPVWNGKTWTEGASAKELAAWEAEHPAPETPSPPPTETEQLRADVDFIAALTGVDLT